MMLHDMDSFALLVTDYIDISCSLLSFIVESTDVMFGRKSQ